MKITHFGFENPQFNLKRSISSSKTPHFSRKSRIFPSKIHHLNKNHTFSL
ncbi:hypothetical protein CP10139811_1482 [Chlamydia ibidis]|uniref:Uncharacterized protein n=1 Tax=Chlamydia ibidis TaxID=1405396 RepID=S7J1N3_9CHLA|nr:hypothetical protein CP8484711_2757 [Chlamydia psittaci 84-8471/1]EPP34294.1 hypothetical protein CP10139811_1482 [Chlamydia ibidis]